jgi:excisionase family DNA binding protein
MAEDLTQNAISTPLAVRVREACRLTGIGRSKLYELIAAGEIRIVKVGSITLIPLACLQQFLEQRTA